MAQIIKDIKTWLMQWFYTESEVDTITGGLQTQINNKADTSTVSALTTTVNGKADKTGGASQITDSSANTYTNISSSLTSSSTQAQINSAINTKIGNLVGIDFIVVVSSLPTASASTMGKLYLVAISGSGDNNFAEYVTVHQNSTYSWEKLGEISASGLSVAWNDITGKPSVFPPQGHSHDDSEIAITDEDLQTDWEVTNQYEFNAMAKTVTDDLDSGKADVVHTHIKSDITDFSHTHGQITNEGRINSSPVTFDTKDKIVITDFSDSSALKRVAYLLTDNIQDGTAHSNIGSSANATQSTINSNIDTALGNKANSSAIPTKTSDLTNDSGYITSSDISGKSDKTATIGTTITLVNAGETNEGCIIFNTIS